MTTTDYSGVYYDDIYWPEVAVPVLHLMSILDDETCALVIAVEARCACDDLDLN